MAADFIGQIWQRTRAAAVALSAASAVTLRVTLTRLGGQDLIEFRPQGDFLRGATVVREPHSFSVTVEASHQGRSSRWSYDSFEGRTRIEPQVADAIGLQTELAGPARLSETVQLYGQIVPDNERVRQISARFDGAIQSVAVTLGQSVERGQLLAVVESNESLQTSRITAPIAGIITERTANAGEQTAGRRLFTIVDTSSVWADLAVFPADRARAGAESPALRVAVVVDSSGSYRARQREAVARAAALLEGRDG